MFSGPLDPLEIKEDVVQPDDQIEVKSSSGSSEAGQAVAPRSLVGAWCFCVPFLRSSLGEFFFYGCSI